MITPTKLTLEQFLALPEGDITYELALTVEKFFQQANLI